MLMVMNSTGDKRIEFGDVESASRDEAKELFDRMMTKGAHAFKVNAPEGDTPIKNFDQVQGEVLIVPRIVGG